MGFAQKKPRRGWYGDSRRHTLAAKGIKTTKTKSQTEVNKGHQVLGNCPLCNEPVHKTVKHGLITTEPTWRHDYLSTGKYYHKKCWEDEDKSRVGNSRATGGIKYKIPGEIEAYITKE